MKRKTAAKGIALIMVSVLLAGCAGGGGTPSNDAASAQSTTADTQEAVSAEAHTGDAEEKASFNLDCVSKAKLS